MKKFSYFQFKKDSICTALACRPTSLDTSCTFTQGSGAAEGSICDSGKVVKVYKKIVIYYSFILMIFNHSEMHPRNMPNYR